MNADHDKKRMVRVDVSGKDTELWTQLRSKLFKAIHEILDTVVIPSRHSTVGDEGQRAVTALLDSFHARLRRAGIENDKIEAEVAGLYAKCELSIAQARKTNAEAAEIEFDTAVKRLKTALGLCRVLSTSDGDDATLVISAQVEALLDVFSEVSSVQASRINESKDA